MPFDDFLSTSWADHADRADEVAARLARSFDVLEEPAHVPRFVALLTHVHGEHLGTWDRGVALLRDLRARAPARGDATAERSIAVGIATLRHGAADPDALAGLDDDERIRALAAASAALAGRNAIARAVAAYEEALRLAQAAVAAGAAAGATRPAASATTGAPPPVPSAAAGASDVPPQAPSVAAARALAVGGNSLAVALERKADRSADEVRAMRTAAEAALAWWQRAGTWLEEERAWYRLAKTQLQAGDAAAAVGSARRCDEICRAHDAPLFERFFAHAIVAIAERAAGNAEAFASARARALDIHAQLPDDEKSACEADRQELAD